LRISATIRTFDDGRFRESAVRHGGITEFDQGASAVCDLDDGSTVLLTSRRMVPFSLAQLTSCGIDPLQYRFLIAKGVNAPIAAYQEVCNHFVRVNTPGSTCADMTQLTFQHRRLPMFPFEPEAVWPHAGSETKQASR
jgi:microcystin degradation protein MlrC